MKVELVSIGNDLLFNEILDTNAAYATRCLREMSIPLSCLVTVGDEPSTIADVLRSSLRRAEVVIAWGGLGSEPQDHTRQALATLARRSTISRPPWVRGAALLGSEELDILGLSLKLETGTILCLPGPHREMVYLFESEVLPLLQQRLPPERATGWLLLRTAGIMESNLRQRLAGLRLQTGERLSYNSFAGLTDVRLAAEGASPSEVDAALQRLSAMVHDRLGEHIYGQGQERLEQTLLDQFAALGLRVAIAECGTASSLAQTIRSLPGTANVFELLPLTSPEEIASFLNLESMAVQSDLTQWCRLVAEGLRQTMNSELSLLVYNNSSQGGVQLLVTLATGSGVSMIQRSFGGHPENIDQWACTLGLVHLRRWVLTHDRTRSERPPAA